MSDRNGSPEVLALSGSGPALPQTLRNTIVHDLAAGSKAGILRRLEERVPLEDIQ
jgi:hypothetical protein